MRSPAAAVAWAKNEAARPSRVWRSKKGNGICLQFVRTCLDIPARYPSAKVAWSKALHHHRLSKNPPAGYPVFWRVGSYDHVALSAGDGYVYSTDIRRIGKVDLVPIAEITRKWGATYLGWTEDLNGYAIAAPDPVLPPAKEWIVVDPAGKVWVRGDAGWSLSQGHNAGQFVPSVRLTYTLSWRNVP